MGIFKYLLNTTAPLCGGILVTTDDSMSRIQQFVSAFDSSRLGGYLQKLCVQEREEFSQRFLQDFLLLSLKIATKAELRVL